jgi:cbb3-type cytochrome oxidase cytochrome c subunit
VKCHSAGDQAAIAPFEAYAPNLAHVSDRLRHEYFTHWMRNPQYYLPGTKMPSFADADGNTAYRDILGGDAARQYEAIWNYLLAGEKIAPAQ